MSRSFHSFVVVGFTALFGITASGSDEEGLAFFERKIRPILVQHCYGCHSPQAEEVKADYLLDTRQGIRRGGISGRDAVIPGDVESSQLIEAIRYHNEGLQMPPKKTLSTSVIRDFEQWVAMGAPDPRNGISRLPREIAAENHWAWTRPSPVPPPDVKDADWAVDPIDRFVLASLEETGMHANPPADRMTLLRRVTVELTGLPPTPEELDAFVHDPRPLRNAFARVVDRLLEDESFGERWGRHWLDVARYGESSGYSRNMLYPYAWRYRDYVIDSYNADKPFNQFLKEQIAGDLLPEKEILGTAFLTIGAKTFNEGDLTLFNLNIADDQIDVTCRAFLALTANCSRCHDHKYDPIPMKDYYALAGIFLSSRHLAGSETNVRAEQAAAHPLGKDGWMRLQQIEEANRKATQTQREYLAVVKERDALRKPLQEQGIDWKKNPTPELREAERRVSHHQSLVQTAKSSIPETPPFAMAVIEGLNEAEAARYQEQVETRKEEIAAAKKAGERAPDPLPARPRIADSPLYDKGVHKSPLDPVNRGALSLFDYPAAAIGEHESGRLQLAEWIADPRNPLTARVYVNRIWHHLFGRGLVASVDNFGVLGEAPSHPELLDYLALQFMADGWSTKGLIRRLVLTNTYLQSSQTVPAFETRDPDNVYLWRFAPQLLEGEVIRDSILAVADQLDRVRPVSQVEEISNQQALGRQREIGRRDYYQKDVTWDVSHRSVYLPMTRGLLPDMLTTFDAADPNLVVGRRQLTIVPAQSLYLMNSSIVLEQSRYTAQRVLAQAADSRLKFFGKLLLGRSLHQDELASITSFLEDSEHDPESTWARLCHTLICSAEFRTLY